VFHYIYYNNKPDIPWCGFAKYCLFTLNNTVNEPQKPLTDFTQEHVTKFLARKMESATVRLYFQDGSEMDLHVEPHIRVCDSLQQVFERIKLKDRAGFGIFQVGQTGKEIGDGREIYVPLNACLLDYDPQMRPSVSPVLYKSQAARLVFKRRLYTDLTSEDPLATKLLYYQALIAICDESLPCAEKELLRLLAMHRIIDNAVKTEPIANANMLSAVAVKNILPIWVENWSEKKRDGYTEKIATAKAELQVPKKEHETLMSVVRDWPLFGCQYFTAKYVEEKKEVPKNMVMGISSQGVYLVHGKDKKIHEDLPFFRVVNYDIKDDIFTLTVKEPPPIKIQRTHKFKTIEAEEIAALMTTIMEDIESKTSTDAEF